MYDRLGRSFGKEKIFFDVQAIPYGADFRRHLEESIRVSFVMLAIIGFNWPAEGPDRRSMRENEKDFVRIELETAFRYDVPILPVLMGDAIMPREEQLPRRLRRFSTIQAASVSQGRNFDPDMDRLISAVERLLPHRVA